jgi:hypothetical protein
MEVPKIAKVASLMTGLSTILQADLDSGLPMLGKKKICQPGPVGWGHFLGENWRWSLKCTFQMHRSVWWEGWWEPRKLPFLRQWIKLEEQTICCIKQIISSFSINKCHFSGSVRTEQSFKTRTGHSKELNLGTCQKLQHWAR